MRTGERHADLLTLTCSWLKQPRWFWADINYSQCRAVQIELLAII